jgi:hypothetical protein
MTKGCLKFIFWAIVIFAIINWVGVAWFINAVT